MAEVDYSVRINADGRGFVGGVRASREEMRRLRGDLDDTGQASRRTSQETERLSTSMGGLRQAAATVGGVLAVMGIADLGREMVATLTETERLRGALQTATGSVDDAAQAFARLESFASETPFALEQSVEAFIRLKNLGLDPSEAALRSYGNTAAAMGTDLSQFIEAVADATTGEFERLKEFGIRARDEGETISLTFQGVTREIEDDAQAIEAALRDIGETNFGGAMEDQMNRLPGLFSNLSDEVSNLVRAMGDAGLTRVIANTIRGMTELVGVTRDVFEFFGLAARSAEEGLAHSIELATNRADNLRDVLDSLEESGRGNTEAARQLRSQIEDVEQEIVGYREELEKLQGGQENTVESTENLIKQTSESAAAFDAHVAAFQAYQEAQKLAKQEQERLARVQEDARNQLKELRVEYELVNPQIAEYEDSVKRIKEVSETLNLTQEQTNRLLNAARERFADNADIMGLFADKTTLSTEQIINLSGALEETGEKAEEAGQKTEKALIRVPDIAEESARGLQRAFSATFRDIFDKGIDGFSGFFDRIKDLFFNLLAELAAAFAASGLIQMLGGEGGINIGGMSISGASGSGGGFGLPGIPGFGGIGQGINNVGLKMGFGAGTEFGPMSGSFTSASLSQVLGAAGIGFTGGSLLNNLIGGNSTFGGIGGGLGAGIGMMTPLGPLGALAGGAIGSLLGGLFGNQTPPNQTSAAGLDFGTGTINVQVLDPETQGKLNKILDPLQELAVSFRDAGFSLRDGVSPIVPDVGVRDDIQLGDGVTVKTPEEAIQVIVDRIFEQDWFLDMPPAVEELIKNFEGTSEELVSFTKTVLSINQQLPQLQAVFGNQSLETFTGAAEQFGGVGNFNNAVSQFSQQFGFGDEILEATIGGLEKRVSGIFDELGTSAETFEADFKEAIQGTLTPEEIKKWVEGGLALSELTKAEESLAATRNSASQEAINKAKEAENFNESIQQKILRITDPVQAEFESLLRMQEERLNEAYRIGADIEEVNRLTKMEREQFWDRQRENAEKTKEAGEELVKASAVFDQAGRMLQEATGRMLFTADAGQIIASEQSRQRSIQSIINSASPALSPEEQARQLLTSQQSGFEETLSSRDAQRFLSRGDGFIEAALAGDMNADAQRFAENIVKAQQGLAEANTLLQQLNAGEISGEVVLLMNERDKVIEQLVNLGASESEIIKVRNLYSDQIKEAKKVTEDSTDALEELADTLGRDLAPETKNIVERYQDQSDALRDLINSATDANPRLGDINQSLMGLGNTVTQVFAAIEQAQQSVMVSAQNAVDQITLSGLDAEGQFNFFRERAISASESIETLTDPDAIANASVQATNFALRAFNVVDPSKQGEIDDELIEFIRTNEETTNQRLEQVGETVKSDFEEAGQAISDKFGDALNPFITANNQFANSVQKLNTFVERINSAAEKIDRAASKPQEVRVTMDSSAVGF